MSLLSDDGSWRVLGVKGRQHGPIAMLRIMPEAKMPSGIHAASRDMVVGDGDRNQADKQETREAVDVAAESAGVLLESSERHAHARQRQRH
ncbi:hypothetical protein ANO11243_031490 [Dothideomycetidae sp. 11243]|nr:hypothetical protein ANO11243_031490 [fungal sp. No.11243]